MAAVDELTSKLAQTNVDSKFQLSFKKKGLKLNKAEDGNYILLDRNISHSLKFNLGYFKI